MCDTTPVPGAQVTVWGDGTAWSVTWWYQDGQTITRIGDMTVVDPGEGGAHIHRFDPNEQAAWCESDSSVSS